MGDGGSNGNGDTEMDSDSQGGSQASLTVICATHHLSQDLSISHLSSSDEKET